MGRHGAEVIAKRFGKAILELGGNNAIILTKELRNCAYFTVLTESAKGVSHKNIDFDEL